jgi:hypothetical protein
MQRRAARHDSTSTASTHAPPSVYYENGDAARAAVPHPSTEEISATATTSTATVMASRASDLVESHALRARIDICSVDVENGLNRELRSGNALDQLVRNTDADLVPSTRSR